MNLRDISGSMIAEVLDLAVLDSMLAPLRESDASYFSYHSLAIAPQDYMAPIMLSTLGNNLWTTYTTKNFHLVDPSVTRVAARSTPCDFNDMRTDPMAKLFYQKFMRDRHLGTNGIHIPVSNSSLRAGIVTIAYKCDNTAWKAKKEIWMSRWVSVARAFDGAFLSMVKVDLGLPPKEVPVNLNDVEKTIVQLIVNGKSAPEISKVMNRSEETIKTYIKDIRSRFNAPNTASLAAIAIHFGLAQVEITPV